MRDGGKTRLLDIVGRADRTLILFYDPECENCARLEQRLAESPHIASDIASGRLQIIAVDANSDSRDFITGGQNQRSDARTKALSLPMEWTVGYSPEILDEEIYYLRSAPTLYLIDRRGRVILRDANPREIGITF